MKGWSNMTKEKLEKLPLVKSVVEVIPRKAHMKEPIGRIISKHYLQRSPEKNWLAWQLYLWCCEHGFQLLGEYRFHPERKWRFDWYIDALKVGIEWNGIMSEKSRHTTVKGYSGDMDKINAAQALGLKVLQYTPLNYKSLIKDLNQLLL